MILIKTFAGEYLIRQDGDLVRKLRKLLQRVIELVPRERLCRGARMDSLFEQGRSICFGLDAMRRLALQFRLSFQPDIDDHWHCRPFYWPLPYMFPDLEYGDFTDAGQSASYSGKTASRRPRRHMVPLPYCPMTLPERRIQTGMLISARLFARAPLKRQGEGTIAAAACRQ